jgi:hypothetical protein
VCPHICVFDGDGVELLAELHHVDAERSQCLTDLRRRFGLVGRHDQTNALRDETHRDEKEEATANGATEETADALQGEEDGCGATPVSVGADEVQDLLFHTTITMVGR